MADPATALAALGTASSVIQVIDFAGKVASAAFQIATSSQGSLEENTDIERLARNYNKIASKVHDSAARPLCSDDQLVEELSGKCTVKAGELLDLLAEIKVPQDSHGMKRIWHSFHKGTKATWKRSEILSRQQNLKELNSQLATALLQLLKSSEASKFEDLLNLIQLQSQNIANALVGCRDTILQRLQDANSSKTRLIINSLEFPEMKLRRETIAPAVHETYEWIFSDPSSSFQHWLTSEDGVFWINGKAGSGKSTLMKFLSSHQMTRTLMEQWTGSREFLVVDFYFWYLGTPLQKSVEGLMRSILHQLLTSSPEVAKIACPQRWTEEGGSDIGSVSEVWTEAELEKALTNIASTDIFQKRLCFFIDGLDEFHGDHQRLVNIIQKLAQHDCIKLCVSSRPWNVFIRGFEYNIPQIRLEDLTRDDIVRYVYGELSDLPQSKEFRQLVSEVVDMAQGVFLWVFLVVASLRSGFIEGDDIEIMRRRLNSFPSDLEDYFDLILSRVDNVYKRRTAKFLRLAVMCFGLNFHNVPQFLLWWLISHAGDSLHFVNNLKVQYLSDAQVGKMAKETQKSLRAACKDLLYVTSVKDGYWTSQVLFLHRTVFEYLQSDRMNDLLQTNCPSYFGDTEFFVRLQLAWYRMVPHELDVLCEYHAVIDQTLQVVEREGLEPRLGNQLCHTLLHYVRHPELGDASSHRHCGSNEGTNESILNCNFHGLVCEVTRLAPESIHGTPCHPWPILYAALGLLRVHEFSLRKVDQKCVTMLLDAGADPNQHPVQECNTIWHLFLFKWYSDVVKNMSNVNQASLVKQADGIWPLASVLIENGADMDSLVLMDSCIEHNDDSSPDNGFISLPGIQPDPQSMNKGTSSHVGPLPSVCTPRRILEFCVSGVIVEGVYTVELPCSRNKEAKDRKAL